MNKFHEGKAPDWSMQPTPSGVVEPRDHTPVGLRNWVQMTCAYLGVPPTELSKASGLAASTVNRFLRSNDETTLSARTIGALVATARRIEQSPDFAPKHIGQDAEMMLVQVWVNGHIAADKYEFNEWRTPLYDVRVPILTPYFRFLNVGFEVDDDHAAPAFPKGTIVINTILRNQGLIRPKPGDFVTMSRSQSDKESEQPSMEITIRRIADSPLGDLWIVPINSDSGIPELHLGPADHIDFNALPPLKRPLGIITGSIQHHSRG